MKSIIAIGTLAVILLALTYRSSLMTHAERLVLDPADCPTNRNVEHHRGHQSVSDADRLALSESYGKLPLSFEVNTGQTDQRVRFLSRGNGYSLFLTSTEAVLRLVGPAEAGSSGLKTKGAAKKHGSTRNRSDVLRMKLLGSNPTPIATGLEELPGKSNYFMGDDPKKWRTNIPNYGKVRIEDVYPGVDLVYYGNQRQLEYDFIVAPGANPSTIRLGFAGAEQLEIDAQGELALRTRAGQVRWQKPVMYQVSGGVRRTVEGHYVRKGKKAVGFSVGSYDPGRPLIIDPVLVYSTYLGGSGFDNARGIAVDTFGNAYITGFTNSNNFPTFLPIQPASGGGQDLFVTKLNAAGSALVYSTYLGGSDLDEGHGIAVDSAGNAYVTGVTLSTNFPTTLPIQPASGGGQDTFVTKLNAAGTALLYSTYLGGTGFDQGLGIAVDSSGAYAVGFTGSTDFPTTASAFQTAYGGGFSDAFVTKLNAAGSALVYSTYLGGSNTEDQINFSGIAVDSSGNAYVTGQTLSSNFPTLNPIQAALSGSADAFVTKLNAAGSTLVFSTYLGGTEVDQGQGIAVDSSGNAYVAGETNSTDFPTLNPLQAANGGADDATVTKLNAAGALVYSTYLGGTGFDSGRAVAVDSLGNAYVTGGTLSLNFPTLDPIQGTFGGGFGDTYVTKLNTAGSALVYSTYLGGSSNDGGTSIAIDASGNAFVSGGTGSINFPTTPSAFQTLSAGSNEGFVVKIGEAGGTCSLTCPPNQAVPNDSNQCGAVVNYPAPTASEPCGMVTCNPAAGSFFLKGTTTVTCTTVAGPSCSFTVTVNDTQAPTIGCPPNQTVSSPGSTPVNYPPPTIIDNCPGATSNCAPASGSTFPVGTTTVNCTATDASSNTANCSFTVTVTPVCTITCPPNQTASANATQCGASVSYPSPNTSGQCGAVSCSPASGSFFGVGSTTVTCTVSGGPTCSFTVTVVDDRSPVLTCPTNITKNTDPGKSTAVIDYVPATVTDNCPGATFVCLPPSGFTAPVGVTTVTCTGSDASNNTSSCSFIVTVIDSELPGIRCPANVSTDVGPAQNSAVVSYPAPAVSDNLPGASAVCVPPSGSTFPLGVTTVVCTARDLTGNQASCGFTVTVIGGNPIGRVIIPGGRPAIEFGTESPVPVKQKPQKKRGELPCGLFSIQNPGFAPLRLTLAFINRVGADVDAGRISDPAEGETFELSEVASGGGLTVIPVGSTVVIAVGAQKNFCLKFAPGIPALASTTTGLRASQAIPDVINSRVNFSVTGGGQLVGNVNARVETGVKLINPNNPRKQPFVTLSSSGDEFTVSFAVFDSNLDINKVRFEFLDAGGSVVAGPFDVDLVQPVRERNLVRGQSFSVEQRFTGARNRADIKSVRVSLSDSEGTVSTSTTKSSTFTISATGVEEKTKITLPRIQADIVRSRLRR